MPSTQVCMFCRYKRTLGQGIMAAPACSHGLPAPAVHETPTRKGHAPGVPLQQPRQTAPPAHLQR